VRALRTIRSAPPLPLSAAHRSLIRELTLREIAGRYRGATLGALWSLLTPFLMLAVYTVAFGHVLGSRWPGARDTSDFAIILFVGLSVHGFLAECLSRAPMLVVGNSNYVKRIVFPLELLPWPVLGSAVFHLCVNFLVLLVALLFLGRPPLATALLSPIILLTIVPVALGGMWLLSALGVYFRDIHQLMPPLLTAMLFLSSAVVPVSALPERYQAVFLANPLTPVIDAMRGVLLDGQLPEARGLVIYAAVATTFALFGYLVFRRVRPGFADVL